MIRCVRMLACLVLAAAIAACEPTGSIEELKGLVKDLRADWREFTTEWLKSAKAGSNHSREQWKSKPFSNNLWIFPLINRPAATSNTAERFAGVLIGTRIENFEFALELKKRNLG